MWKSSCRKPAEQTQFIGEWSHEVLRLHQAYHCVLESNALTFGINIGEEGLGFILKGLNFLPKEEVLLFLVKHPVLTEHFCQLSSSFWTTQLPQAPITATAASAPSDAARERTVGGEGTPGNRLTHAFFPAVLSKAEHQIHQQQPPRPRSLVVLIKQFKHIIATSVPSEMANILLYVICQSRKQL